MNEVLESATRSLTISLEGGTRLELTRSRLLVEAGEDEGEERTLGEWPLVVGRGKDADFRLSDSAVSRRHLRLVPLGSSWSLEDLGSRSGTLVNGDRVETHTLVDGDEIRLGTSLLRFRVGPDELVAPMEAGEDFSGLKTQDPAMRRVFGLVRKVAPLEFPVLIQGETGTGKEGLARALHDLGASPEGPFITVDCTLLRGDHLRSELFGHTKGAFTGATQDRHGAFVRADGGTLLLDEIGELPLALQPALLRVLEQGEVAPLGGERTRSVRVRVVAATHRDLRAMAEAETFRRDLLYRLSALLLEVPPLRSRGDDAVLLAQYFAGQDRKLSPEAVDRIRSHDWPGNVRELRRAVEVAAQLGEGPWLHARDLSIPGETTRGSDSPEEAVVDPETKGLSLLEQGELQALQRALSATGGNQSKAAEILGINRSTLYRKLRRFGLK